MYAVVAFEAQDRRKWIVPLARIRLLALVLKARERPFVAVRGLAYPDASRVEWGTRGELQEWAYDEAWKPRRNARYRAIPDGPRVALARSLRAFGEAALDRGVAWPEGVTMPTVYVVDGTAWAYLPAPPHLVDVVEAAAAEGCDAACVHHAPPETFDRVVERLRKAGLDDDTIATKLSEAMDGPPPQAVILPDNGVWDDGVHHLDIFSAARRWWMR